MLSRRRLLALGGCAAMALTAGCAMTGDDHPRGGKQSDTGTRRVRDAFGEWWVPDTAEPAATVVLVHGGYWQPGFTRHLEDDLAADLTERGYLVWNIDYRPAVAGWPEPLVSAAAAYDHVLSGRLGKRVDRNRVAVVGHSAGGQIAMWLASRNRLPSGAPGSVNSDWLRPALAVGQAPIAALGLAAHQQLGGGAAVELCGGMPEAVPDRYREADPSSLVAAACPVVLIHGRDDDVVPLSQSQHYLAAAHAVNADAKLAVVLGGHFEHLVPASAACQRLRGVLASALHVAPHTGSP
jgi:acetyl esterase/lipase